MITKKNRAPAAASSECLRARGLRLTRPRRVILDVVRTTGTHPSAALVYRRVRRLLPRVSLGTVYRNLRRLAAEGLVQERAEPGGLRFDGNTDLHDHFTCVACGRILDLPRRPRARPPRAATTDLEILSHRVEFYGRCRACLRRGPSSPVTPQRRSRHGR